MTNTIFWADSAQNGSEIYADGSSEPVITYCDIQGGWSGDGNINVDPLFRDSENGDYHLQSLTNPDCGDPGDSPCIDAGDPSISDTLINCDWGLGTIRSDMGAYGGPFPSSDVQYPNEPIIPEGFDLSQNYPNPFNQTTKIEFTLAKSDFVSLKIYDILGRKVRTLVSEHLSYGSKSVFWDGKNDSGKDVASGIYFYQIKVKNFSETKKLVLLK